MTIVWGSYKKNRDGKRNYHPYFQIHPTFTCLPLIFGNLYFLRERTIGDAIAKDVRRKFGY